jgi:hypothetical protein
VKRLAQLTLVGILLTAAVPAWAGEVKLSFSNGLVTIIATDASPRQILAEWARLGQVKIINLERLSGGPITLQLTNVPEAQALETLLRGSAGYVAAPRQAAAVEATSRYDRILLMPGVAPAMPAATSTSASPQPANRGRVVSLPTFDAAVDDDDIGDRPRIVQMPAQGRPGPGPTLPPGQSVSPGQFYPQGSAQTNPNQPGNPYQQGTAYQPASTYPGTAGRQVGASQVPQAPPNAVGSSVPGAMTAPMPIQTSPYTNAGPPPITVPDDAQNQPGFTPGIGPGSATRPGESTAPTPGMFRNPYGIPEAVRPPVTDPSANPYGLPNAVKPPTATPATTPGATTPGTTTPGTTATPPGPIKTQAGGEV